MMTRLAREQEKKQEEQQNYSIVLNKKTGCFPILIPLSMLLSVIFSKFCHR